MTHAGKVNVIYSEMDHKFSDSTKRLSRLNCFFPSSALRKGKGARGKIHKTFFIRSNAFFLWKLRTSSKKRWQTNTGMFIHLKGSNLKSAHSAAIKFFVCFVRTLKWRKIVGIYLRFLRNCFTFEKQFFSNRVQSLNVYLCEHPI